MSRTDIIDKAVDHFGDLFDQYASRVNGARDTPFFKIREQAISHLRKIGFPKRNNEDYKYTNLIPLLSATYRSMKQVTNRAQPAPHFIEKAFTIYFENGQLIKDQSDMEELEQEIEVMTVEEALKNESLRSLVLKELSTIQKEGTSAFTLLSLAFAQGMVYRLPAESSLSKPIQVVHRTTDKDKVMMAQLSLFIIGSGAKGQVIEVRVGPGPDVACFQNIYHRVLLGKNAHFSMYRWQDEGLACSTFSTTEVKQAANSCFTHLSLDLGGKLIRNNIYSTLIGEGITTNLYGAYLAKGKRQHIDNQTFIDHATAHCQSNELYKGIIDHHSKAVFNGKVMVRPEAQKTNAFQQNANLLLSKHARVDTKPQLEIFADDVKCSHGATIGQLDEQALYYLMTRGLTKEDATAMLQSAFLQEVFSRFEGDDIASVLAGKLQSRI